MRGAIVFLIALSLFAGSAEAKHRKKKRTKPKDEKSLSFKPYQGASNFSLFQIRSKSNQLGPTLVMIDSTDAWNGMIQRYPHKVFIGQRGSSQTGDVTEVYGKIDFEKQMYVEWIWGEKRSTGYSIELKKLAIDGKTVRCELTTKSPKKTDMVGAAMTTPSFSALVDPIGGDKEFVVLLNGKKTKFQIIRNPIVGVDGYYDEP